MEGKWKTRNILAAPATTYPKPGVSEFTARLCGQYNVAHRSEV